MQRLLNVTYGYLKFTFACMLGATALFFLAGLAITATTTFLIIMAVALVVFLIVRMEAKSDQHTRELSKKADDPKGTAKALVEFIAYAEAANMVLASLGDQKIDVDATSLWISEWSHKYDPKSALQSPLMDKALLEKAELTSALNSLQVYEKELAANGFRILYVSKKPAEVVAKAILHASPKAWSRMLMSHHESGGAERTLSIVFLHDTKTPFRIDFVENLLKNSFQIVRGGVDLKLKSRVS